MNPIIPPSYPRKTRRGRCLDALSNNVVIALFISGLAIALALAPLIWQGLRFASYVSHHIDSVPVFAKPRVKDVDV